MDAANRENEAPGARTRDFVVLWSGQTLSVFGSAISVLALPTVAILLLRATPFQLGILQALSFAAFPTLGLFVGVLADRMARRRIMIVADLFRAVALCSIPIAALVHGLRFTQLAIVALVTGVGTVFFDISYQSYLPSIVAKSELLRANARLEFTRSAAEVAGSGLAGLLISFLGAALTIGIDALSFVVSVASLLAIRTRERSRAREPDAPRATFWSDLRVGVASVFRSPVLRSIAGCTATGNFGSSMLSAVFLIFAYRELHLRPVTLGLVLAFSNVGFIGAMIATRCTQRFGLGATLAGSTLLGGISPLLLPLAENGAPVAVIFCSKLMVTIAASIYNVNQVSFRQTLVAQGLLGRMNATMRTIVWGTLPLGALVGGALGSLLGIVPTILVAGAITSVACLWILLGPVRRLQAIDNTKISMT